MSFLKRNATLLSIILFLILAALIVTQMRRENASPESISCALDKLLYDLHLSSAPPRCMLGINVTFDDCAGEAFPNAEVNRMRKETLMRQFWLPRIYENLRNNCLENIALEVPGNIDRTTLKRHMMELLTTQPLEVVCSQDTLVCYHPGIKGRVLQQDIRSGRNRLYLCELNFDNWEVMAPTLIHEIAHISISHLSNANIGLQEPYPNRVGGACGR